MVDERTKDKILLTTAKHQLLLDDDDVSSKDGAGATGGFIEDAATGKQVLKKEMNDFIIPTNNPNNSDASKE